MEIVIKRSRSLSKYGTWASVMGIPAPRQSTWARGIWSRMRTSFGSSEVLDRARAQTQDGPGDLLNPQGSYRLHIYLPRFFLLSPRERIETLVHELYHLHPKLDGRLRVFPGRHRYHGPTPMAYRKRVQALAQECLHYLPELKQHDLLKRTFIWVMALVTAWTVPVAKANKNDMDDLLIQGAGVAEPSSDESYRAQKSSNKSSRKKSQKSTKSAEPKSSTEALSVAEDLPSDVDDELEAEIAEEVRREQRAKKIKKAQAERGKLSEELNDNSQTSSDSVSSGGADALDLDLQAAESSAKVGARGAGKSKEIPSRIGGIGSEIRATEGSSLHARPEVDANVVGYFGLGEQFEILALSRGTRWVKIRSGRVTGWAPSRFFSSQTQAMTVNPAIRTQDDLKEMGGLKKSLVDQFVKEDGQFFESPDPLAKRSGIVRKGDLLSVLSRSRDGKFVQVELQVTRDKGWLPSSQIEVLERAHLDTLPKTNLGVNLSLGSDGMNFGIGADLFRNFLDADADPRSRMELGVLFDYYLGQSLKEDGVEASASYYLLGLMFRYGGETVSGFLGANLEVGLTYRGVNISSNLSEEVFRTTALAAQNSGIGVLGGVEGIVNVSPRFGLGLGVRANFSSTNSFVAFSGMNLRF